MVDFQQRWPVLDETTPRVRGAPDIEQASADMILLQKHTYTRHHAIHPTHICSSHTHSTPYSPFIVHFDVFRLFWVYNNMRKTQFQLTDLNKRSKVLDFQQISPTVQDTVKRLLNQGSLSGDTRRQEGNFYCWLYIDPMSSFALLWSLSFMIVFYLVELQISLCLAFGPTFLDDQLALHNVHRTFYLLVVVFLMSDIVLSLFQGYYSAGRGRVVDDFREILHNYLWGQFPFDVAVFLLYLIPLFYVSYGVNFLQLLTAGLLWVKKFRYQGQVTTYLQYSPIARVIFMVVSLFSDVLMMGNYGACIFIGMDLLLYNNSFYGSSSAYYWLTNNTSYPLSLVAGPWYYQYIYGQEFSTGTLSTLAPGPFAKNPIQAVYAIVVMILFMVLASYVGEVLIQIAYTYSERRLFHEDNIISFDNYMQLKEVDRSIRSRVYNFFQLVWQVELKVESKEQQALIDKLPTYLKEELLLEIGFARSIYFLQYLPQQPTLEKLLSVKLERSTIDANSCLFQTCRTAALPRSLYFVKEGMAKFYVVGPGGEKVLNLTNVQRMLGVYEFVSGQDYGVCCKSIDLCLIQKLSFHNFTAVINKLGIWEEFKELQHKVLLDRNMKIINKTCILCLQSHAEDDCPDLHVSAGIRQAMTRSQCFSREQERSGYKRKALSGRRVLQRQGVKQRVEQASSIFNLFQNINLGKMILDINKLESLEEDPLDQVTIYRTYFKPYNIA